MWGLTWTKRLMALTAVSSLEGEPSDCSSGTKSKQGHIRSARGRRCRGESATQDRVRSSAQGHSRGGMESVIRSIFWSATGCEAAGDGH